MNHPKEFAEGLSIGIIMDGNGRWAKQRGLPLSLIHIFISQQIRQTCMTSMVTLLFTSVRMRPV